MSSIYNFSAGPAMLPAAVLEQAQAEMLDFQGSGISLMSMSHRSDEFMAVAAQSEADLRALLAIPSHYKVLFLQGGATAQFALLPLNFAAANATIDYIDTGIWSKKAIAQAQALWPISGAASGANSGQISGLNSVKINIAASSAAANYHSIPDRNQWQTSDNAAYLHFTDNETIGGLEFAQCPVQDSATPLFCDMSSSILSKPIEVSRYGVIYAGAQKNIGPAGLTIVIIREDLLAKTNPALAPIMRYEAHAEANSMLNTPPTYSWYIAGLVFQWLQNLGGIKAIAQINRSKARLLYAAIDESSFYNNPIKPAHRSKMNVPFTLAEPKLEAKFLDEANKAGLSNLKGHRSVGGMRASIYNAMPLAGVQALLSFMRQFEKQHA